MTVYYAEWRILDWRERRRRRNGPLIMNIHGNKISKSLCIKNVTQSYRHPHHSHNSIAKIGLLGWICLGCDVHLYSCQSISREDFIIASISWLLPLPSEYHHYGNYIAGEGKVNEAFNDHQYSTWAYDASLTLEFRNWHCFIHVCFHLLSRR